MIKASIVADSLAPSGTLCPEGLNRITTFKIRFPSFILPQVLMYGTWAKSVSSNRAKPNHKWLSEIAAEPAMPLYWTSNKPGMQGDRVEDIDLEEQLDIVWETTKDIAVLQARNLSDLGAHKQHANRLLQPFQHTDMVVTTTKRSLGNFFHQRLHHHAQPEIQELARAMAREFFDMSEPEHLDKGEWHLPFIVKKEAQNFNVEDLIKASAARCARTSYSNHDKSEPSMEKDLGLYEKLAVREEGEWDPIHGNPLEHQVFFSPGFSGRHTGWQSFRDTLNNAQFGTFTYEDWIKLNV